MFYFFMLCSHVHCCRGINTVYEILRYSIENQLIWRRSPCDDLLAFVEKQMGFNPLTARVLDGVCKVTLTFESADGNL